MVRFYYFLLIYSILLIHGLTSEQCHTDVMLKQLDADYIIAGFIPAHVYDQDLQMHKLDNNVIGFSSAIIYAIEQINQDKSLLPGVKLGYVVKDTCDESSNAINFTLEYILETLYLTPQQKTWNTSVNGLCINEGYARRLLVGVIGAASSPISAAISTVLSTDYIPQVSYASTSTIFSNRRVFRSFLRTVPSDFYQAQAIADVLRYFEWSYVSAFASDDEYGRVGMDELRQTTEALGICLAKDVLFPSPLKNGLDLDQILNHLKTVDSRKHVVILWCSVGDAVAIIRGAANLGLTGFTWVGTETWTTNYRIQQLQIPGNIIGIDIYNTPMQKFEEAFKGSADLNCKNPWFVEYLAESIPCEWFYSFALILPLERYQQVIASVYTIAHGLHLTLNCTTAHCNVPSESLDYKTLYYNALKSNFVVPDSNLHVNYDAYGEYDSHVYFYRMVNLETGNARNIGNWTGKGTMFINVSLIQWGTYGQPESVCSKQCQPGSFQINDTISCCWSCAKCVRNTVTEKPAQYRCVECSRTELANKNHTFCLPMTEEKLSVRSILGLLVIIASVLGVAVTIFFIIVYIAFWDTPVIKSSSRELSIIQLVSLLILFCIPALAFFDCNEYLCMARTFIFGFFLSTAISVIVVKTYRLLRVFNGRFSKVSRFLQNQYQILFVYVFVFAEFTAVMFWYVYRPVAIVNVINKARMTYHPSCGENDEIIFFIVLAYVFVLALVSGYMAFRARSLPENFNEAQFISVSMFTVCVIWLMYLPLYLSLKTVSGIVAFLMINFLSTFTILMFLYFYRIKVVLFHPRLNSPEYFRKTATKATVKNFQKDITFLDGRKGSRMMSVITFESFDMTPPVPHTVPARRYSIGIAERDTPDSFIELKPIPKKRRASFSSMTILNNERIFHDRISIESLLKPLNSRDDYFAKIKKSISTPNLLDSGSNSSSTKKKTRKTLSPPANMSRSVSDFMKRVSSTHSLSTILNGVDGTLKDEEEEKSLLDDHVV